MSVGQSTLGRIVLSAVLIVGFIFLYAPILILIVYSFNASTSTTVWSGFSLRWHDELWQNDDLLRGCTALC